MENNDNNNLSELDQLKAQYETLKQQFDKQEIINDRLMKSSIKRNVDFFTRYRKMQGVFSCAIQLFFSSSSVRFLASLGVSENSS